MKIWNTKLVVALSMLASLYGCGTSESSSSELKWKKMDDLVPWYGKSSRVTICLKGSLVNESTAAENSRRRGQIRRAILAWTQPLTKYRGFVNPTAFSYRCNGSEDFFVEYRRENGRAFAGQNIVLFRNSGYGVLLHEMGHIVGLNDTYVEGQNRCQRGQPNSMMCHQNRGTNRLAEDDIQGITSLYCEKNTCVTKRLSVDIAKCRSAGSCNIALKPYGGKFVGWTPNQNRIEGKRPWLHGWEIFKMIFHSNYIVSLRVSNGTYIGWTPDRNRIEGGRPHMKGWEKFKIVQNADGKVSFKAFNGNYMGKLSTGKRIAAKKSSIGKREKFEFLTF